MAATKKELILAALVLLAVPVLVEFAFRIAHVQFEPQLYTASRDRGWTLRPGAGGVVAVENRQYVHINTHGFRDRERTYDKPANTVRIAVLGNSWTEAVQVPLDKIYSSVLEQKLTQSSCFAGKQAEVLNFGVAGYSTGQELLTIQQEVWKYHPDVVIVAFYPARDIVNNMRELNNAVNPEQSPYFVYRDGKLVLDDLFRSLPALQGQQILLQNIRYRASQSVRVLQAINALQRFGKIRAAMASVKEKAEKSGVDNLEYTIYAPPSEPIMQTAWRVTEGLLVAMRDEVIAHGAEFRIVALATRPQVIPDHERRLALMRKLDVPDFSYADNRIRELGAREGIPVTTLAPALSQYAEANHAYLNGFNSANLGIGHWNETGHRLAAEVIAADLCGATEKSAPQAAATAR
ncbi:MAG: SGNH/GDSL hydrolase family protein [Candidatus Acidiferrum sp.]